MYNSFKQSVLGRVIGDGQCVSLVVNNPQAYVEHLFPNVPWTNIIAPVTGAKDMAGKPNQYLTWVANDVNNPNQVPPQGAIMVFDQTPYPGYTNTFDNPYGHTGICDSANASGYWLLAQNSPYSGEGANVTFFPWKYRHCSGWYIVGGGSSSVPPTPPVPAPTGQTITLPKTTGPWHLRDRSNLNDILYIIDPRAFGRDLSYAVQGHPSEFIYWITSQSGIAGAIDVEGSDVVIS